MHKNHNELLSLYGSKFIKINEIVNSFDPCGLLCPGVPSDEYDCLTDNIFNAYQNNYSREEIRKMIIYQLEYHFGCIDLTVIQEPFLSKFHNDLDKFIDKVERELR